MRISKDKPEERVVVPAPQQPVTLPVRAPKPKAVPVPAEPERKKVA